MARARRIGTLMDTTTDPQTDRPRTNAELREEATGRMIDTAIRLVAERGATRLSLVDVGRESGYSHSLPNYYFKTKKQLLVQVYTRIVGNFQQRAKVWAKAHARTPLRPGLSHLESTIGAYCNLSTDGPGARAMHALWAESISSMPELLEDVRPLNQRSLQMFEEQIRIAIQRGEIDPGVDVESLAVMIFGMLRGVVAQWLIDPDRVDLARVADAAIAVLHKGLAPTRPATSTTLHAET